MKKLLIAILGMTILMIGCTKESINDPNIPNTDQKSTRSEVLPDTNLRLAFPDIETFQSEIKNIDYDGRSNSLNKLASKYLRDDIASRKYVGLLSKINSPATIGDVTYYEALGYDSLVPNINLACLLNSKGEVEVGLNVIKIAPEGTYIFPKEYEGEFEKNYYYEKNKGIPIDSIRNKIGEHVILYKTFDENPGSYSTVSLGDCTEFPESDFDTIVDDVKCDSVQILKTTGINEPDFNTFAQFSADRHTAIGKLIQQIIGASKKHTIKYNNKRRLGGSFYFYNYGVYSEIGVKGWTDKKNWIGWSKTACDELRVGWKNVILLVKYPDTAKQMLNNIRTPVYKGPEIQNINGRNYYTATLIMPEYEKGLRNKILKEGVKAIFEYIKSISTHPSDLEKAEAFLVSTRTECLFVCPQQNITKSNEKSYCHVFQNEWMTFPVGIGWSNQGGFFIGHVNQNNVSEIGPWLRTIFDCFNQSKVKLAGGEVYICARFGNVWKGMKITKKES